MQNNIILIVLSTALSLPAVAETPKAPAQPVPFSHKQHAALELKCQVCHQTAAKSERAGLPDTARCMACHIEIQKNSPAIQKLAAFHKEEKDIPWVRVYRIPDFIFFSHARHVTGKVTCSECHGPVEQREILAAEVRHTMNTCMDCHRVRKASNKCNVCHELGQ